MKFVIGCLCAAALTAVGCADGRGIPTVPSTAVPGSASTAPALDRPAAQGVSPSLSAAPRSGAFRVTKECSEYTFLAGGFCTITSSTISAIERDSRVIYAQAAGATSLDSEIVLDLPGPGNNTAFGHCALDFGTLTGLCTFSGGTGKFTHFQASAKVSSLGGDDWAWVGTYSFSPR